MTTTYHRGDPDPTPHPDGTSGDCPARKQGLYCTWDAGHTGPHVAGMGPGSTIAEVWTDDQEAAVLPPERAS